MSSIFDWSLTPGDNATADSDINWQENQFPSTVNNSARQVMGRIAEWRNDISGQLTPSSGTNAKVLTANSAIASYANGLMLAFRNNASNTGATTINVNGLGAKAIRRMTPTGDAALTSGMMITGQLCIIMYSTAADGGSGAWLLLNPTLDQLFAPAAGSSSITTVGALNSGSITSGFGNINIGSSSLTAGATTLASMSAGGAGATPVVATRSGPMNISYEARPNSGDSIFWGLGAAGTFSVKNAANLDNLPWMAVTATSATFSGTVAATSFSGDGSTLSNIAPSSRTLTAGNGLTGGGDLSANRSFAVGAGDGISVGDDAVAVDSTVVRTTRTISTGSGLSGGGNLSANRTLSVVFGTTAGTVVEGNDSRISSAVQSSRTLTAGNGLTGGGDLSANRSFAVGAGDGISVGATTVSVDNTVARVDNQSSANATNFPIGHILLVDGGTSTARNQVAGLALHNSDNRIYLVQGAINAGTNLQGNWRHRGFSGGGCIFQRIS